MTEDGIPGMSDTALSELNEEQKFFLAHLPFTARPVDIREYFSSFGTVNFVKLVHDKSGKSKGYGFLYMNDRVGDAAVEEYARRNNNRITLLNKAGVFLARNDRKRQNPIRNPAKKSHDDHLVVSGKDALGDNLGYMNHTSVDQFSPMPHVYHPQGPNWNQAPVAGVVPPVHATVAPPAPPRYPQDLSVSHHPDQFSYDYSMPVPAAPHVHVPSTSHSSNSHVPPIAYGGATVNYPQSSIYPPVHTYRPPTKVLLENLPLTSTPEDITNTLFQYSLRIIQCVMEYDNDPKASWCYAHIELASPEEATRCIALAQQSLLEYRGRILTASEDTQFQLQQQPQAPLYQTAPIFHAAPQPQNYPPPPTAEAVHLGNNPRRNSGQPSSPRKGRNPGKGRGQNRRRSNRRHRPY